MATLTHKVRFEIFRRDRFKCQYCGAQIQDAELHVDHVVPRKLGGTDDPWNLVTACASCNMGKGSRSLLDPTVPEVDERNKAIAAALSTIRREFEDWAGERQVMMDHFYDEWRGCVGDVEALPDDYETFVAEMVGHGLNYGFLTGVLPRLSRRENPWGVFMAMCQRELVSRMFRALGAVESPQ